MPRGCKLTFDLWILEMLSKSRVSWANSVPILVLLSGTSLLKLRPMYATARRQTCIQRLMSLTLGLGHNNVHIISKF